MAENAIETTRVLVVSRETALCISSGQSATRIPGSSKTLPAVGRLWSDWSPTFRPICFCSTFPGVTETVCTFCAGCAVFVPSFLSSCCAMRKMRADKKKRLALALRRS